MALRSRLQVEVSQCSVGFELLNFLFSLSLSLSLSLCAAVPSGPVLPLEIIDSAVCDHGTRTVLSRHRDHAPHAYLGVIVCRVVCTSAAPCYRWLRCRVLCFPREYRPC